MSGRHGIGYSVSLYNVYAYVLKLGKTVGPDKTGHFRTLGSGCGGRGAETLQKVSHSVSRGGRGSEQGRYSLVKESAGPQRQVGEELGKC